MLEASKRKSLRYVSGRPLSAILRTVGVCLSVLVLPAFALVVSLSPPAAAAADATVSVVAVSIPRALAPGQRATLRLRVKIAPGWHINSNAPLQSFLIPTSLSFDLPEQLAASPTRYPAPIRRKLPFAGGEELALFEKEVLLETELSCSGVFDSSSRMSARLRYQACTDTVCKPPAVARLEFNIDSHREAEADASQAGAANVGSSMAGSSSGRPAGSGARTLEGTAGPKVSGHGVLPFPGPTQRGPGDAGLQSGSADKPRPGRQEQRNDEARAGSSTGHADGELLWEPFDGYRYLALKRSGRPFVLGFTSKGCMPCREMEARTFRDRKVLRAASGFAFMSVDMSVKTRQVQAARSSFRVPGAPMLIFYGRDGRETTRRIGFVGPEDFIRLLEQAREAGAAEANVKGEES